MAAAAASQSARKRISSAVTVTPSFAAQQVFQQNAQRVGQAREIVAGVGQGLKAENLEDFTAGNEGSPGSEAVARRNFWSQVCS